MEQRYRKWLIVALLLTFSAWSGWAALSPGLDSKLRARIDKLSLTGAPENGPEQDSERVDISSPLAQLGKKLFFTKALSGEKDTACASCHHPFLGGGDGLSVSVGVQSLDPDLLGPGRSHPALFPNVGRNAATTFNASLYKKVVFHDGRVERLEATNRDNKDHTLGLRTPDSDFFRIDRSAGLDLLAAQARFPVASIDEMRGPTFEEYNNNQAVRLHLAARLQGAGAAAEELQKNDWEREFRSVFESKENPSTIKKDMLMSYENVAKALAAYQRSQQFVNNSWRRYVNGDVAAISRSAKRGAILFLTRKEESGADCIRCHSGDHFTDEGFHVLATPQVGAGKGDGPLGNKDFGRFRESNNPIDLFAFRTPSLLNVEVTAPYGHAGAYETLKEIVKHHLNPEEAIRNYLPENLKQKVETNYVQANTLEALAQLKALRKMQGDTIYDQSLTEGQVNDLVEFLKTLTDPCVKDRECLKPWIPTDSDADPDGLRLNAKFAQSITQTAQ